MLSEELRAQGWIEHDGGPCPVRPGRRVYAFFLNGKSSARPVAAEMWGWDRLTPPHDWDIIAYRPETPDA